MGNGVSFYRCCWSRDRWQTQVGSVNLCSSAVIAGSTKIIDIVTTELTVFEKIPRKRIHGLRPLSHEKESVVIIDNKAVRSCRYGLFVKACRLFYK